MEETSYTDAQVWDFVRLCMTLARTGRRSVRAVLDRCPPCHFFMLERLHDVIRQRGQDGAIYMGDLAAVLHDSPQSVSRMIRTLEQDGLAERTPDPADRRRTLVRLTPLGDERRGVCEGALRTHMREVWQRLEPEHTATLLANVRLLEEALAATLPETAGPEEEEPPPPPPGPPRRGRRAPHPEPRRKPT